jgi:uncharacterized BrkB/YihY/UPF0761 family membrane protein
MAGSSDIHRWPCAIAVMKKFGDDQAGSQVTLLTYYAFVGTFPLLLAVTTILSVALRKCPELQRDLVNSAFAEFPIIGTQIHDQFDVATFGNAFSLALGVLGFSAAVVSPTLCKTHSPLSGRCPRWIGRGFSPSTCGRAACYCYC